MAGQGCSHGTTVLDVDLLGKGCSWAYGLTVFSVAGYYVTQIPSQSQLVRPSPLSRPHSLGGYKWAGTELKVSWNLIGRM